MNRIAHRRRRVELFGDCVDETIIGPLQRLAGYPQTLTLSLEDPYGFFTPDAEHLAKPCGLGLRATDNPLHLMEHYQVTPLRLTPCITPGLASHGALLDNYHPPLTCI